MYVCSPLLLFGTHLVISAGVCDGEIWNLIRANLLHTNGIANE